MELCTFRADDTPNEAKDQQTQYNPAAFHVQLGIVQKVDCHPRHDDTGQ
jgi:hypothetical protein